MQARVRYLLRSWSGLPRDARFARKVPIFARDELITSGYPVQCVTCQFHRVGDCQSMQEVPGLGTSCSIWMLNTISAQYDWTVSRLGHVTWQFLQAG